MNVTELGLLFGGALAAAIASVPIARRNLRFHVEATTAQRLAILLVLIWALLVGTLAILRHLAFNSSAYDLGIFDQVIWNSAQGRLFENSVMADSPSFLGHHFSPILLALVPLYWIYPDPVTLLALQALLLAIAGLPIFWLARDALYSPSLALAVLLAYLLHPATSYVALFDFHEVTLATPLLSTALYLLLRRRNNLFYVVLALLFLVKEEMGLVGGATGLFLAFSQRRWMAGLGLTAVGVLWTLLIVRYVIPGFHPSGQYFFGAYYAGIGQTPQEIVVNTMRDPGSTLGEIVSPNKLTYLQQLFSPLGALPLLGWPVLVVALPTLLSVSLTAALPPELIRYQYSAALLPSLLVACITGLAWLRKFSKHRWASLSPCAATFVLVAAALGAYLYGPLPMASNFAIQMYRLAPRLEAARQLIGRIPPQASVIAQSNLVPQISQRRTIQLFGYSDPMLRPDYYFLDTDSEASRWPFPPDYDKPYVEAVARVKVDAEYRIVDEREEYLLIRREAPDLENVVDATFDDQITLVGHRIAGQQVRTGGSLELTLYWQAKRKPDADYTLFVHLVDGGGKLWGQSDGYPVGRYPPTSAWEPGRLLRGEWTIPVAREVPAGEYYLIAGLYDLATMKRLPVSGIDSKPQSDAVIIQTASVVAAQR